MEIALPLISVKANVGYVFGTAVVITPYLGMTASHVIRAQWNKYEYRPIPEDSEESSQLEGTHFLWAYQQQESGVDAVWEITKIWASGHSDIAFLRITPASENATNYRPRGALKVNLVPPSKGERISCFGYHSGRVEIDEDDNHVTVGWDASPSTAVGEVIEVYEKRAPSICRWPSFRVNTRFEGGMSGGPAFNDSGELCGIICTGWKYDESQSGEDSIVSSLWPAMATEIDMDREGNPPGQSYPVLELAHTGVIKALNLERVVLVRDENGRLQPGFRRNL